MPTRYASFLIRCWRLDGNEWRIKIEHVQTGATIQVTELTDAFAWLGGQWEREDNGIDASPSPMRLAQDESPNPE